MTICECVCCVVPSVLCARSENKRVHVSVWINAPAYQSTEVVRSINSTPNQTETNTKRKTNVLKKQIQISRKSPQFNCFGWSLLNRCCGCCVFFLSSRLFHHHYYCYYYYSIDVNTILGCLCFAHTQPQCKYDQLLQLFFWNGLFSTAAIAQSRRKKNYVKKGEKWIFQKKSSEKKVNKTNKQTQEAEEQCKKLTSSKEFCDDSHEQINNSIANIQVVDHHTACDCYETYRTVCNMQNAIRQLIHIS